MAARRWIICSCRDEVVFGGMRGADTKVEVASAILFRGFGSSLASNWQESLPGDEEAMVVAVGKDWAAVATSEQVLCCYTSSRATALGVFYNDTALQ